MPAFQACHRTLNFWLPGYMNIGNYEIGPLVQLGHRQPYGKDSARFDLATNKYFSKKWYCLMATWPMASKTRNSNTSWMQCAFSTRTHAPISPHLHKHDFDRGQQYYDDISQDNIFALAIRKKRGTHQVPDGG